MNRYLIYTLLVLAFLIIFIFLPVSRFEIKKENNFPAAKISEPLIEAKAAMAQDLITGETLYSKNNQTVLPLASLTKIISGLIVLDNTSLGDEAEVSKFAVETEGPSSLRVGEHLKIKDLLAMAMVESSNDAITALFEYTYLKNKILPDRGEEWFLDLMRKKAEALGARSMNFNNITGLDVTPILSGGYGSAEDLLRVAKMATASDLWQLGSIREIVSKEGILHVFKPTNELGPELTPLVGSKTGYTDLAGGNLLVIVEYPIGHPIGIVVLGSSEHGRFSDVKTILDWIKAKKPL